MENNEAIMSDQDRITIKDLFREIRENLIERMDYFIENQDKINTRLERLIEEQGIHVSKSKEVFQAEYGDEKKTGFEIVKEVIRNKCFQGEERRNVKSRLKYAIIEKLVLVVGGGTFMIILVNIDKIFNFIKEMFGG